MLRGNRREGAGHPSDSAALPRCNAHIFPSPALISLCRSSLVSARFLSRAPSAVAASDGPKLQLPTHRPAEAAARSGSPRVQRMAKTPRGALWFHPLRRQQAAAAGDGPNVRRSPLARLVFGSGVCTQDALVWLCNAMQLRAWEQCAPAQPVRGSDGPGIPQRANPAETGAAASGPPALGTGGCRSRFEEAGGGRQAERR